MLSFEPELFQFRELLMIVHLHRGWNLPQQPGRDMFLPPRWLDGLLLATCEPRIRDAADAKPSEIQRGTKASSEMMAYQRGEQRSLAHANTGDRDVAALTRPENGNTGTILKNSKLAHCVVRFPRLKVRILTSESSTLSPDMLSSAERFACRSRCACWCAGAEDLGRTRIWRILIFVPYLRISKF